MTTIQTNLDLLSMAYAVIETIKDAEELHNELGPNASPDDCTALMRQLSLRFEDIVRKFPQSDEKIVQESRSSVENLRETIKSTLSKHDQFK